MRRGVDEQGGLPSSAWADAVNLAYEAGVVLVCAAGNSYAGLPTSLIVYPARFQRVIAACGIMAEGHPFYGLGGPMEGNVGPASKMATAMAAYTPNIPWLRLGCRDVVDMDGNGTPATADPIAVNDIVDMDLEPTGDVDYFTFTGTAGQALFILAQAQGALAFDPDPYFGRGSLRAAEALQDSTFRPPRRCGKPTQTAPHSHSCTCCPAYSA